MKRYNWCNVSEYATPVIDCYGDWVRFEDIKSLKDKVNIYESFFRQIHMHRAITMNNKKVIEALDIISLFGTQGPNMETYEELIIRQDKAREKMRLF